MAAEYAVTAAAGSLRSTVSADVVFPHKWTDAGVAVQSQFTGAHLLHLATAGCVLNDLYREAATLDVPLRGVRVSAEGDFDTGTWQSTGVTYRVELDSDADQAALDGLVRRVDEVAEIPKALRAGARVERLRSTG